MVRVVRGPSAHPAFALVYLGLGDDDATVDWLGTCVEERDALMPWMKFVPCFDRLRSDPRFDTLLERQALPSAG